MSGGKASLVGTFIGAALMIFVRNGIKLLNVNSFWQQVVIGSIILILIAVAFVGIASRRSRRQ